MSDNLKSLSLRQAQRCETAKNPTCKCRCGGKLHGIGRAKDPDAAFFNELPDEDPHHIDSAEQKRAKAKAERAAQLERASQMMLDLHKQDDQRSE